jgi:hypothetical protein
MRPIGAAVLATLVAACGARSSLAEFEATDVDSSADAAIDSSIDTFPDTRVAECAEGAIERMSCGRCGETSRTCVEGLWTAYSSCTGEGSCTPGEEETTTASCPPMETRVRACNSTCTWGPFGPCARRGWVPIASPEPLGYLGRYEHVAVWTGTEMLVWSGRTPRLTEKLREGAAYDPAINRWRLLPDSPIGSRHGEWVTAAWTGTTMIVWGGRPSTSATTAPMADGAELNPKTNTWLSVPPSPIGGRGFVRGVWTNATRELVIWGGSSGMSGLADGAAYSPAKRIWRVLAKSPLSPRINHALLPVGSKVLVYGGRTTDGVIADDGALYDPVKDTWSTLPKPFGYPGVIRPHTGAEDSVAALFGSYGGSVRTGAWFSAKTDTWTAIPEPAVDVLVHPGDDGIAWFGANRLWIWQPFWGTGDPHFAAFHLPTGKWARHPESLLEARSRASVVWTGSEAILWGGCCRGEAPDHEAFADGAIYRP